MQQETWMQVMKVEQTQVCIIGLQLVLDVILMNKGLEQVLDKGVTINDNYC